MLRKGLWQLQTEQDKFAALYMSEKCHYAVGSGKHKKRYCDRKSSNKSVIYLCQCHWHLTITTHADRSVSHQGVKQLRNIDTPRCHIVTASVVCVLVMSLAELGMAMAHRGRGMTLCSPSEQRCHLGMEEVVSFLNIYNAKWRQQHRDKECTDSVVTMVMEGWERWNIEGGEGRGVVQLPFSPLR